MDLKNKKGGKMEIKRLSTDYEKRKFEKKKLVEFVEPVLCWSLTFLAFTLLYIFICNIGAVTEFLVSFLD